MLYTYWKASGACINYSRKDDAPISRSVDIKAYPNKENPDIFILNYIFNDFWEILSADKRTAMVIASGKGKFSMDDENVAKVAWVKDLAQEINALHNYEGEIKNSEERYAMWQEILSCGNDIKEGKRILQYRSSNDVPDFNPNLLTRASSTDPDTTYHPVPGHYECVTDYQINYVIEQKSHLISTRWSQVSPFNQYCPMDYATHSRAKAGSDAVAGAQMVYYMHRASDACPEVYRTGYCDAYITDPMDWTAMDQFDKSADNWSLFQTSDSTRMASVMIANIGRCMQLNYGLSYTGGDFEELKQAIQSEYELESFSLPFDGEVDPYEEIYRMAHSGIPSIVHTSYGQNNTQPHTFIVDGCKVALLNNYVLYQFVPDDPMLSSQYSGAGTIWAGPYFTHNSYETFFCMNWGNGSEDNSWYIDSSDWHINTLDYSNREALLSFRMGGSVPEEDME